MNCYVLIGLVALAVGGLVYLLRYEICYQLRRRFWRRMH